MRGNPRRGTPRPVSRPRRDALREDVGLLAELGDGPRGTGHVEALAFGGPVVGDQDDARVPQLAVAVLLCAALSRLGVLRPVDKRVEGRRGNDQRGAKADLS